MHEVLDPPVVVGSPHALFSRRRLTWWPEIGIGWYPVEAGVEPYDRDYFERFHRDAQTPLGQALMKARVKFVEQHWQGMLIDVGIGSGAFIERRRAERRITYGYDVNPAGIEWLQQRKLFFNPYAGGFNAVSMWDVLEHMPNYHLLLEHVCKWLFVSTPIYRDAEHVLRSKHFRPTEHCFYFSRPGLIIAMSMCGFELVSESNVETELGREDIGTFAFRRQS